MQRNHNYPKVCLIEKVINETHTVRTLVFSDEVMSNVLPGQFAMVWIPGINEIPMSVMITNESGKAAFTVRKHGPSSTGLFNVKVGQQIGIRGPYGNSFDLKQGKLLLVGGGTGLIPMMRLLTFVTPDDDVTVLIGAKSKEEVFFEDLANNLLKKNKHQVIVTTDDGSYGKHGFVTDKLKELIETRKIDFVLAIGPIPMMKAVADVTREKGIQTVVSLNPIMVDGTGMCGGCRATVDNKTVFVCVDGPEFDAHKVDFKTLMTRNQSYLMEEKVSVEEHDCKLNRLQPKIILSN